MCTFEGMNLRLSFSFCVFCLFQIQGMAQYPESIHNEDLRSWLKINLYDGLFNDLGYASAREQMYSFTDEVNGKIYCIYTDFEMESEVTTYPNPINAEHIIPQSFYGAESPMKSDIHNIRPSHQSVNSARSNHDFGVVPDNQARWYGLNTSGGYVSLLTEPEVSLNFSEGANSLFEPQEDRKGDLARHIFYFYTVYPTQAGLISELIDLNLVYQWHLQDPVDDLEIQRNQRTEQVQGNRNPYVDYEELVYDAWLWQEVPGCIDATADNYNPEATVDDGSCVSLSVGCTNPAFMEFSPEASIDDGSCLSLIIAGCRYENADNYNPEANVDENGSCLFGSLCFGDFNNDGSVNVSDLGGFLGSFGEACL